MPSTIRPAAPDDLGALRALVNQEIDEQQLATIPGEQYTLVLDDDDGRIAAAAHLTLDDQHGHLRFFAVSERHRHDGISERMLDVIESLCEAFGAAPSVANASG